MDNFNGEIELLNTVSEYICRLNDGIRHIVELFRCGEDTDAIRQMEDIITGLQWTIDAISVSQAKRELDIDVTELNGFMIEMMTAFDNADYILLSDLFEYEIVPVLENWALKVSGASRLQ